MPLSPSDSETTIEVLRQLVASFVQERAWDEFHNPKDLGSAIAIESAELMELFLWKSDAQIDEALGQSEYRQRVREELADVLILCLSLSNRLDIDVTQALLEKLSDNAAKYPIREAFGRSEKYTHYLQDERQST